MILACRDAERAEAALARLQGEFPDAALAAMPLDLSDPASIAAFPAALAKLAPSLDVVIHCAGVYYPKERLTPDGVPREVAVNAVGPTRLTDALLPMMTPAGRMVYVTSLVDKDGEVKSDPLADDAGSGYAAYARSKFLLSGYVLKRSRERTASEPLFIAAHPGITKTPLLSKEKTGPRPLWSRLGHALVYLVTQPPEKSSLPILFAAAGNAENGALYAPRGPFRVFGFPRRVDFSRRVREAVDATPSFFSL